MRSILTSYLDVWPPPGALARPSGPARAGAASRGRAQPREGRV